MKSRRMRPAVVMGSCGALVFALGTAGLLLGACTDDSDRVEGGSGGSGGGQPSSGGTPTAGGNPSTGGSGGGATGGTGGKGTGGDDGGTDDGGACKAPSFFAYDKPGCGGTVAPICWDGLGDACATTACACDGTELSGCGVYNKPWRHAGSCADGATDSGTD